MLGLGWKGDTAMIGPRRGNSKVHAYGVPISNKVVGSPVPSYTSVTFYDKRFPRSWLIYLQGD